VSAGRDSPTLVEILSVKRLAHPVSASNFLIGALSDATAVSIPIRLRSRESCCKVASDIGPSHCVDLAVAVMCLAEIKSPRVATLT